jgi:hypothetical protein
MSVRADARPLPWTKAKRDSVKSKIDREAERAAKHLGAECVFMIAFFGDGDYLHALEGGCAPMPLNEFYRQQLAAREMLHQSSDEEISVQ